MNLDDLRGLMSGQDCLVVATGPSASWVSAGRYESHWTIGCGGACAFCRPDFAIGIGPRNDRYWPVIYAAAPLLVFTHTPDRHPRAVRMSTNIYEWMPRPSADTSLEVALTLGMSPFYGVAVAIALGFRTVGLIGVDLNGDGGRFSDTRFQEKWEREWARMNTLADENGVSIINLNRKSKLKAIRREETTWEEVRVKS